MYGDRHSRFTELLNIDESVTIQHSNLHVLATRLCNLHHGLVPELMTFFKKEVWHTILEIIQHLKQEMLNLFLIAQKQCPFFAPKYGNFC